MKVALYVLVLVTLGLLVGCSNTLSDTEYVNRAQDFLDKGEVQSATIELKNALQQNPKNAQARRLLGVVHLKAGNVAAAEKELIRASELGAADEAVLPLLARALLMQGKYDELQALSLEKLMAKEQKADVLASQGLGKLAQGKLDRAAVKINRALSFEPKSSYVGVAQARLFAATEQKKKAYQVLERLLEQDENYALAWALLGDLLRSDKEHAKAEDAYGKAIENRIANTSDYLSRALVRIDLRQFSDAQKDLDILKKRIPNHPMLHYGQGLVFLAENKLEEAKRAFGQSLKVNQRQLLPKYYLALINLRLGKLEQADDYGNQAFAALPASVSVRELLATIKLKQGEFAKVDELVRPIVEQRDKDIRAIDLLASALLGQKKIDQAIPLLEKLIALQPGSAVVEMRFGAALWAAKRGEEGVSHIENALKKDPNLHQARLLLVRYYLDQKQMGEAMQVAEAYSEAEPKSPVPWNLIGGLNLKKGDRKAAAEAFEQARKLEAGGPAASHALAGMAIRDKDYKKARAYYEEVLAHHKDHLATLLKRALLDAVEKKETEMVAHLQQAAAAHQKAVQPQVMLARYYLLKNQPGKVAPLMLELDDRQKNNPEVLEVQAFAKFAQKKYRDAEYNLKALLELRPKSPQLHFLMAKVYDGQKDAAAIKRELEQTVELAPKHLLARLALARMALLEKDEVGARAQVAELKKFAPEHPDVLYLDAVLMNKEGSREEAAGLLEQVFKKAPTTATMLAVVRQKWAMGNPEEALAVQEKWTQEHPADLAATLSLAGAYTQKGDLDKALVEFKKVLQKDEKNVIALNDLAWHLRDKQPARALEYAERAAELAPESAAIMDTLAVVLLKNGDIERARRQIERALAKKPKKPAFRYHGAMIAAAAGDKTSAIKALQSLLGEGGVFSEKAEARQLLAELQGGAAKTPTRIIND